MISKSISLIFLTTHIKNCYVVVCTTWLGRNIDLARQSSQASKSNINKHNIQWICQHGEQAVFSVSRIVHLCYEGVFLSLIRDLDFVVYVIWMSISVSREKGGGMKISMFKLHCKYEIFQSINYCLRKQARRWYHRSNLQLLAQQSKNKNLIVSHIIIVIVVAYLQLLLFVSWDVWVDIWDGIWTLKTFMVTRSRVYFISGQ